MHHYTHTHFTINNMSLHVPIIHTITYHYMSFSYGYIMVMGILRIITYHPPQDGAP